MNPSEMVDSISAFPYMQGMASDEEKAYAEFLFAEGITETYEGDGKYSWDIENMKRSTAKRLEGLAERLGVTTGELFGEMVEFWLKSQPKKH